MFLCNAPIAPGPGQERCVIPANIPNDVCSWIPGENLSRPDGPVLHLPTIGLPPLAMEIQHETGECAWCDAERWRNHVGVVS